VFVGCVGENSKPVETEEIPDLPRHTLVFANHSDVARQDYDIWRICADGTQMASLVVLPGQQAQLAISPDGNELVYTSKVNGVNDIWRRSFMVGKR
jgi:Tol biopolymer transport system component